jgi:predicted transcriptional regulator
MNNERIIKILADEYSRKILSATSEEELSAQQISVQLNIPQATVYRKIKLLEGFGFLKAVKSIISPRGNEEKYYKSTIRKVMISFEGNKFEAKVKLRELDRFMRLWKVFSDKNLKAEK